MVEKNGYHSPNICQWNIYRCSNPCGFKNNVCKYIDSKIYMDSAHHQNNNQPRHTRRRRNKAYGNWKLGIWTKWDPYWWTIPYGWSIPNGNINSRVDNI